MFVPENQSGDAVVLADQTGAAPVYIDANGPAFAGLRLIADAVAGDIEAVTGQKPVVVNVEPVQGVMIVAGLVNEEIITKEGLTWEIGPSNEDFKSDDFERYQIQVKQEGNKTKIIVAGADKRGTIYPGLVRCQPVDLVGRCKAGASGYAGVCGGGAGNNLQPSFC